MWRMNQEWRAFQREVPWLGQKPPSEHVRDHFRFTTQPFDAPGSADHTRQLIEQIGSDDLLLYSSDYPHHYAHPNQQLFDVVTSEHAEKIRWRNATETYRLEDRAAVTPVHP